MATYKAVLHNYKRADGTQLIQIRIIKGRKPVCENTGFYVTKKEFNSKKGKVRESNDLHDVYNRAIEKKIEDLKKKELTAIAEGLDLTSYEIKNSTGKDDHKILDFYESQIKLDYKKSSPATNELNQYKYNSFKKFLAKTPDLLIKNVTLDVVERYESFILESSGRGTANIYLAGLSSIMKRAVKKGLMEYHKNPFNDFRYKDHEAKAVFLTMQEIRKLEEAKLYAMQAVYRDVYLSMFLASGMRVGDAFRLKKANIREGRLYYTMGKSGKHRSVPISAKLMKIFSRHITPGREYIFPLIDPNKDERKEVKRHNRFMNDALKEIAGKLGITQEINTHSARHSFATMANKLTKDVIGVQDALGHSDLQTTVDYLDKLNQADTDVIIQAVVTEYEKV